MNKLIVYCGLPLLVFLLSTGMTTSPQNPPGAKKEVKVIVVNNGEDTVVSHGSRELIIHEEEFDGDSGKQVRVTVREAGPGDEDVLIYGNNRRSQRRMITRPLPPAMQRLQATPGARTFMFRRQQSPNVIDLADPGVISFKKKKMSGGREKITVIRQEVKEMNWEEKQIMQIDRNLKSGGDADFVRMNAPRVVRELDIRRKDLPAPPEVPAPVDKK